MDNPGNSPKKLDHLMQWDWEAEVLKILGHPIRLKIIAGLMARPCHVQHIADCLGLPQAVVSQHLVRLKRMKIIGGARDGRKVLYRVISDSARKVVSSLVGEINRENV